MQTDKTEDMRLEEIMINTILETYDVEVPQAQVENEFNRMLLELNHSMQYESMALRASITLSQEEKERKVEELREEAFKLVKLQLVIERTIESGKFGISEEELVEEAKALSSRQNMSMEMIKDFLGEDLGSLRKDLLRRKALEHAYAKAQTA